MLPFIITIINKLRAGLTPRVAPLSVLINVDAVLLEGETLIKLVK